MKRVTDIIAEFIFAQGVKEIFSVTGGGMMFLTDGVAKHPHLKTVFHHHEQAAAMAGISYAKYTEQLGVVMITTGCGGTNSITGLLDAWQDNVPSLFISGQSKRKQTVRNSEAKLRQFGVQEADIISIVESITKYSIMLNKPNEILYHLEKAVYLAKSGRPGPAWLDIPMDVQASVVDEKSLVHFDPKEINTKFKSKLEIHEFNQIVNLMEEAQMPIIIAGQGIRLSKSISGFKAFIEHYSIPFVTSRLGIDVLPSDHQLYIGRIGTKGDRPGNFAVQNADLILVIGSRLSVSSTGHEYDTFGREAKIVVVDIDPEEHKKNTIRIDHFINADIRELFELKPEDSKIKSNEDWVKKCQHWKTIWPVYNPHRKVLDTKVDLYHFVDTLSRLMKSDAVVISDAGSAFYVVSQGIKIRESQRYITSGAQAEMGYTLPASVGVSFAKGMKEVIGITGDGSFQMNIQELQTIKYYNIPAKIFVWNNDGYLSIRASQSKFCEKRFLGTDKTCGVSFPELEKVVNAYGLKYVKIADSSSLENGIIEVLNYPGAVICEVMCIRDQEIIPAVSSLKKEDGSMVSKPLEDMYPFLDRTEFLKEMLITPISEE